MNSVAGTNFKVNASLPSITLVNSFFGTNVRVNASLISYSFDMIILQVIVEPIESYINSLSLEINNLRYKRPIEKVSHIKCNVFL